MWAFVALAAVGGALSGAEPAGWLPADILWRAGFAALVAGLDGQGPALDLGRTRCGGGRDGIRRATGRGGARCPRAGDCRLLAHTGGRDR